MKDFFSSVFCYLIIAALVIVTIVSLLSFCAPFVVALGNGSVLRGVLTLPFGMFGLVQFIRGALHIFDADLKKLEDTIKRPWQLALYIMSSLASYYFLFEIIRNWKT